MSLAKIVFENITDEPVCIWPCGTWCQLSEIEQMNHMSDDYMVIPVYVVDVIASDLVAVSDTPAPDLAETDTGYSNTPYQYHNGTK